MIRRYEVLEIPPGKEDADPTIVEQTRLESGGKGGARLDCGLDKVFVVGAAKFKSKEIRASIEEALMDFGGREKAGTAVTAVIVLVGMDPDFDGHESAPWGGGYWGRGLPRWPGGAVCDWNGK